jgi:hypothetical protein
MGTRKRGQLHKRREDLLKLKRANVQAFYAELVELEGRISKLADKGRPPKRGDNDMRLILDEPDLRRLTDAMVALRRVRDAR